MRDPRGFLEDHSRLLLITISGIVVGVHLVDLVYAPYNGDEGIYLYASRLVMEGKLLYRDTFFHQFPLMPYFYGTLLEPLGGGLYLGRLISVLLSVSAFLLLVPVARAIAGEAGAVVYAFLFGFNFWALSNLVRVKHYALTTFFLSLGVFFLFAYGGRKRVRIVGSLLSFALAAATRISTLPALVLAWVYLLRTEREDPRSPWVASVTFASSLGLIFSYALFVPFSQFVYNTFGLPLSGYQQRGLYRYVTWQLRVFRGLVIFRIPSMAILLLLRLRPLLREWRAVFRSAWLSPSPAAFLAAVSLTLFIVHFYVGQVHEDYHVSYLPLVAILSARAYCWLADEARQRDRVPAFTRLSLFLAFLTLFTGVRYGFFKKDAFQIPSTLPPLYAEAEVMARRTSPGGAEILTFLTIVPYLAHRKVAHGMEYTVNTFRPTVSDEEARAGNSINVAQVRQLILSRRAQAIEERFLLRHFTGFDPEGAVAAVIERHYDKEMGHYYVKRP